MAGGQECARSRRYIARASLRWMLLSSRIVSWSDMPVVIDQSTPDPTTSLAKTTSVIRRTRRQSSRLRGWVASTASLKRGLWRPRSATPSKPVARANSSVQ